MRGSLLDLEERAAALDLVEVRPAPRRCASAPSHHRAELDDLELRRRGRGAAGGRTPGRASRAGSATRDDGEHRREQRAARAAEATMSNVRLSSADAAREAASAAGSRPACPRGPRSSRWTRTARRSRDDREVHVGPAHRAHADRASSRGGALEAASTTQSISSVVDELGELAGAADDVRRRRSSSTKPTSSRPYSGCAAILRSHAAGRPRPAPTISVRRGRMIAGSSQVRTTPRSVGTSTIASAEEEQRLERRVDEPVGRAS